jgi:hydrogenase-4 component B
MIMVLAGLSVIGGLSVLTFTKTFGTVFLGQPRAVLQHEPHEVTRLMLVPQYIIIALMLAIAIVPQFFLNIVSNVLGGMSPVMVIDPHAVKLYSNTAGGIGLFSLLLIVLTGILWFIRSRVIKNRALATGSTWGCGYGNPNSAMQYTGKSFSKPVGKIFYFLLIEKKTYEELKPEDIFPQQRRYDSHYLDFFEFNFIDHITKYLIRGAGYFRFIQNGRTQSYVMYGILFILVMILLTMFNIIQ